MTTLYNGGIYLGMRLSKLMLAVAVVVAAARLLMTDAPEAMHEPDPSPPASIEGLENAVRENAISPYRWLELAEGYEQADNREKARACYHRAEELGPNLPPVWIRAAGFHFRMGETEEGLRDGAHAQGISDASDAFLFQYYDRFVRATPAVIRALDGDRRALPAYLRHLMALGRPDDAGLVWAELKGRQFGDRDLAIAYVEFLLGQHRYGLAGHVWAQEAPAAAPDGYPSLNPVYNGGFEQAPSGCRLDWKIGKTEAVEVDRDREVAKEGKFSLRVRFAGTENVSFQSVVETVVAGSGNHRFSAWLKTEGITTDQGIRFCIQDAEVPQRLNLATDPIRGTNEWMEITQLVAVPAQTNLLNVSVCREPSMKFDNKISGTAWADAVSLHGIPSMRGHAPLF